jgi:hypothetical protein
MRTRRLKGVQRNAVGPYLAPGPDGLSSTGFAVAGIQHGVAGHLEAI